MRDSSWSQFHRPARGRVPWFVFGVTLLLSGVAAWYVSHADRIRANLQFVGLVATARDNLTDAIGKYITALRGTSALFDTVGHVSFSQFHTFVSHLDVQARYPGIRLIAFAPNLVDADLPQFLLAAKTDIPDYAIWPAAPARDRYVPVRYQEPYSQAYHTAIGHDLQTDPPRLAALRLACDSAAPAMSSLVTLSQPLGPSPDYGFIIFVPLYRGGVTPPTVPLRQQQLIGYVFGVFSADEFFQNVLSPAAHENLALRIFEGSPSKASLLYDSTARSPQPRESAPRFHDTLTTPKLAGRSWTVEAIDQEPFDAGVNDRLLPLIFLGGAGISFVLFAVTRGLANAQAQSERNAADLLVAGRALRASQGRLRRLVESNLIGVFFCDPAGHITDANDEFLRMAGLARADLQDLRVTLNSITPVEYHHEDQSALSSLTAFGVGPSYEKELLRPDGSRVPVLIGMASVDSDEDAISAAGTQPNAAHSALSKAVSAPTNTALVAFTIDITQRRLAERELRQAKEAAEKANRSKDQFLAVLSHELRTPLTPVLAAAAVAQTDDALSAETRDTFAMIHRNVELEARLIDDLLDLTRVARGKLQLHLSDIDLHEVLTHAAGVCDAEELTARRLTLRCEFAAHEHHVRGDPARLQQVFWNLVKNAVKFTPVGGTITLSTSNEPAGPPHDAGDRNVIRVDVIDTGIGIEPEVLSKVFDAFEQGSAARAEASGGLGLGLAISRGLVVGHGGAIAATSAGVNRGATFTVRLLAIPAAAVVPAPQLPFAPDRSSASAVTLEILLVEDHVDTAKVMSRLLRNTGHRVQLAHSVADALQLARERGFDLLISDLGLPDGSGLDVIRAVHDQPANAGIPAIALTGYGTDEDIRRTLAAGFTDHLTKPINFQVLRDTIARAHDRRRPTASPVGPVAEQINAASETRVVAH